MVFAIDGNGSKNGSQRWILDSDKILRKAFTEISRSTLCHSKIYLDRELDAKT